MDAEARKAQREYYKAWRAKNPEKVRKYKEDYWKRKAEQMKEAKRDGEGQRADT